MSASDALTAVPDCLILRPAILAAVPAFEAIVSVGGSRRGNLRLTVTETESGLDVLVQGGHELGRELTESLARIAQVADFARLTWGDEQIVERRRPNIVFGDISVVPPPGGFLQATKEGETSLVHAVVEIVHGAARVVDLFAGSGTFSFPVARASEIHAVEGDPEAVAALERGWRHGERLRRMSWQTRDLFRKPLEVFELDEYEAAIVDPPRAGAEAQIENIARSAVQSVAMVSCNPVSFARDASILTRSGFSLAWIDVVDQFRFSHHVELVAAFFRE
jgi:23S rRNA (uracil1939-C5)-methyltransferase